MNALGLCANCLGQQSALSPALRLVGLFLLVPAAVFFVVARVIRRLEMGDQGPAPSAAAPASGGGGGVQAGCSRKALRTSSPAAVPRNATSSRT